MNALDLPVRARGCTTVGAQLQTRHHGCLAGGKGRGEGSLAGMSYGPSSIKEAEEEGARDTIKK